MRYFFPESIQDWGFFMDGKSGSGLLGWGALFFLAIALISYLLGSINSAVIISKKMYGNDVRNLGSGNAGMTNMFRSFGVKAGLLTLAGDVLKALFSVVLGFCLLAATPLFRKLAVPARGRRERISYHILRDVLVYGVLPCALLLLSTAGLVGNSYNPFLYFKF